MRLVRFKDEESVWVGTVADGEIQPVAEDITGSSMVEVSWINPTPVDKGSIDLETVRILSPIGNPGKIICVGLNYHAHAEEGDNQVPSSPLLFAKATSAVIGPEDQIVSPFDSEQLDYEAELAVIIGKEARRISAPNAEEYIAGYTAFNDVTARDVQYGYSQFFRGKSYDTFAPLGPILVTTDDLDPSDLEIRSTVNGEIRQDSTTGDMIFDVPTLLESISSTMTLEPGDIIATGTPEGVGVHRTPPKLLHPGDSVTVEIEGIGNLRNSIVAEEGR